MTQQYLAQLKWQNLSQHTITAVQTDATEERTLRSGPVLETNCSPGDAVDVLFDPLNEKKYVILMDPQA